MSSSSSTTERHAGRILRGPRSDGADAHAFETVSDLPAMSPTRPTPTGDRNLDAVRSAAWDEGVAKGVAEGRERGYAEGFEAGREEGRRFGYAEGADAARADAVEQVSARVAATLGALERAADDLARRDATSLAAMESAVVELALGLAAAVVEREVTAAADPGADAIARALRVAPDRGELVVRLHPADLEQLSSVEEVAPGRALELVADPSVGRGGCVVDTASSHVDARVDSALERARAALLGDGVDDADGLVV